MSTGPGGAYHCLMANRGPPSASTPPEAKAPAPSPVRLAAMRLDPCGRLTARQRGESCSWPQILLDAKTRDAKIRLRLRPTFRLAPSPFAGPPGCLQDGQHSGMRCFSLTATDVHVGRLSRCASALPVPELHNIDEHAAQDATRICIHFFHQSPLCCSLRSPSLPISQIASP